MNQTAVQQPLIRNFSKFSRTRPELEGSFRLNHLKISHNHHHFFTNLSHDLTSVASLRIARRKGRHP